MVKLIASIMSVVPSARICVSYVNKWADFSIA